MGMQHLAVTVLGTSKLELNNKEERVLKRSGGLGLDRLKDYEELEELRMDYIYIYSQCVGPCWRKAGRRGVSGELGRM